MDIFEADRRGYRHKNLVFWTGLIRSLVAPIGDAETVLDLGCGHGLFLQLLFEMQPFGRGVGVDRDPEALAIARSKFAERRLEWPITYVSEQELEASPTVGTFDIVFGQEILWMNELDALADQVSRLLRNGGRAYFTMGSHAENPLWPRRRRVLEAEGYQPRTHSLDDVARSFSAAGFSVGLRRLPIDGFIMYHPDETPLRAGTLSELVRSTSEEKMLFYFGKGSTVQRPRTLQG